MAKGFGIASLVLAIIAIFVPLYGIYISALALLMAAIAGFSGDRTFAIATPLIAGVNTFFLSPALRPGFDANPELLILVCAFLAAPLVAIAINAMMSKRS